MFELCEQKSSLPLERERIRRLMISFNEPVVAAPRHSAQPTRAYICTFKEDEGLSVYIYLYLTIDKVGLIYKYTEEIPSEGSQDAEDEAVLFAEDMGFMIDDIKFDELDTSQQDKLLAMIPMFISNTPDIPKEDAEEIVEAVLDEPIETAEKVKEDAVREEAKKEITAIEVAARQALEEAAVREAAARETAAIEAKKEIAAIEAAEIEAAAKEAAVKVFEPERRLSKFRIRSVADRLKNNKE